MKIRWVHWLAALVLSGLVHMALAGVFAPGPADVLIAGSSDEGVTILGDAFADAQMVGEAEGETEMVEPAETVEATTQEAEPATEPVETAIAMQAEAESIKVQDELPAKEEPLTPSVEPGEAEAADAVAEIAAVEATTEPLDASEPAAEVVPLPRPEYEPPDTVKSEPQPANPRPKAQPKPVRQAKGSQGDADRDSRQSQTAENDGRKASVAGNAAVSNYPGKVARKLRRAVRYPSGTGTGGEARVAFVVGRNGSAGSVRVIRSSGSADLDRAAADAVRRASPFPPIPAGAGRSSWQFVVPILFDR